MLFPLSRDGQTSAVIRESGSQPPGGLGRAHRGMEANHARQPGGPPAGGKDESIHWSSDGFTIQGWLTYPRDYDASRRYPLVVQVHGGPRLCAAPLAADVL